MNTKLLHNSFNAGEISPELFSRPDIQQFRFGAARARNWITRPAGSAALRPGLETISTLASKARAVPFRADGDDYIVTVEAGRFRFWQQGLPVSVRGGVDDVFLVGDQTTPGNIDLVNDVVYTSRQHNFALGEKVVIASSGTPPGGLATVFEYDAVPEGPRGLSFQATTVGPNFWNSISTTTLTDSSESWVVNAFVGQWVWIYDADGNVHGHAEITGNTATTLTFNAVASVPASGTYAIAVPVGITSYNSGSLSVWKSARLPDTYTQPIPLASIQPNQLLQRPEPYKSYTIITLSGPHGGWPQGTRWKWTTTGGGVAPNTRTAVNAYVGYSYFAFGAPEFVVTYPEPGVSLTANQLAVEFPSPPLGSSWSVCPGGPSGGLFTPPVNAARVYPAGTTLFLRTPTGSFSAGTFIRATQDILASSSGPLIADGWQATGNPWLEIENSYAEEDLFELTFAQTQGKLRIAHKNYPALDLEQLSDKSWTYGNTFDTPTANLAPSVAPNLGQQIEIANTFSGSHIIQTVADHGITAGDLMYISGSSSFFDGFYIAGDATNNLINELLTLSGTLITTGSSTTNGTVVVVESTGRTTQRYIVTAVDSLGREFARSDPTESVFNLQTNAEAYNSISWTAASTAAAYRIYKEEDGTDLFGFIAEVGGSPFNDRNIEPDFGRLAPDIDDELRTDYPAAVAFYDQRGVFGGNSNKPQGLWLSTLGRNDELVTRRSPLDTDRIAIEIASREGQVIRHVVPVSELLVLSDTTEWALSTKNTDTLTPTSATIRLQTTVGSNFVRPLVMNNSVLFCSPGNHIHRLGYQLTENSFGGTDLSTRAAHLFDQVDIVDSSAQTARLAVGWFTTSDGGLLGLTYSEEEQVAGWHRHDIRGGRFVSTAVATEGSDDRLYAVVQLDSGGYYMTRLGKTNSKDTLDTSYVDLASRYRATDEGTYTLAVTGSTNVGGTLRVTTTGTHAFDYDSVGQEIVFSTGLRAEVTERVSRTEIRCVVVTTGALPTGDFTYGVTRSVIRHYQTGTQSAVLEKPDGSVEVRELTPDADFRVELPYPCLTVHIGIPLDNELRTMPVAAQLEATGQGRMKHVDHAYVRVFETAALSVGPDLDHLSTVLETYKTGARVTDETRELIESQWTRDGQLTVSQQVPLPATVTGVTFDVSIA